MPATPIVPPQVPSNPASTTSTSITPTSTTPSATAAVSPPVPPKPTSTTLSAAPSVSPAPTSTTLTASAPVPENENKTILSPSDTAKSKTKKKSGFLKRLFDKWREPKTTKPPTPEAQKIDDLGDIIKQLLDLLLNGPKALKDLGSEILRSPSTVMKAVIRDVISLGVQPVKLLGGAIKTLTDNTFLADKAEDMQKFANSFTRGPGVTNESKKQLTEKELEDEKQQPKPDKKEKDEKPQPKPATPDADLANQLGNVKKGFNQPQADQLTGGPGKSIVPDSNAQNANVGNVASPAPNKPLPPLPSVPNVVTPKPPKPTDAPKPN